MGEEEFDATAGTVVRVDVEDHRKAVAEADDTTVLVVGGRPGAAMPPSPFEYWYAAVPAYEGKDYARAIEIVSEALEHYPEHRRGPCCLVCGYTVEKRPLHVVCTTEQPLLILITAYEPKPPKWETPTLRGRRS